MRSRLATAWRHMEYTGNCSGAWGTHRQFNSQLVSRQELPIKIKRIKDRKLGTDDMLWREELPTACATKMPLFQWISNGERNSGYRSFFSSGFPDFHVLSRIQPKFLQRQTGLLPMNSKQQASHLRADAVNMPAVSIGSEILKPGIRYLSRECWMMRLR